MVTIMSSARAAVRLALVLGLPAVLALGAGSSVAQDLPARDLPQNGGAGLRTDHITATGETVPNPGASQSAGTTDMDRGIMREDTKIQSSICKGC